MADYSEYKTLDDSVLSSSKATIINIMKTTVGLGVIGLPAAAKDTGYIIYISLVIAVGCMSFYSVRLLTELCEALEVDSYEEIARKVFQLRFKSDTWGRRLLSLLIFISITISFFGYAFLLKAELPEITKYIVSKLYSDNCISPESWIFHGNTLMVLVSFLIICPLCFARHLDFLKYASFIGTAAIMFCVGTIVLFKFKTDCNAIVSSKVEEYSTSTHGISQAANTTLNLQTKMRRACQYNSSQETMADILRFKKVLHNMSATPSEACHADPLFESPESLFKGLMTIVYSLLNHDVVLSIYAELRNKSTAKMMRVCTHAYTLICALYILTGLAGYFTWYEASVDEFLLTYTHQFSEESKDLFIVILAKIFVVVCTTLSAPIVHYAGRKAVCMMIWGEYSLREYDETKRWRNLVLQFVYPVVFISISMVILWNFNAYDTILNMGGWTGTTLYLFMPPFLWLLYFTYSPGTKNDSADIVESGSSVCQSVEQGLPESDDLLVNFPKRCQAQPVVLKITKFQKYGNVIMAVCATAVLVYEFYKTYKWLIGEE